MRQPLSFLVLGAAIVASASCGDVVRSSRAPVMLTVNSLAPSGTKSSTFTSNVAPGASADSAEAVLGVVMKDVSVTQPSSNNQVTITRYRVTYTRADGHNTPGVDVPYSFDGAVTTTIAAGNSATVDFELVRQAAKLESPLVELATSNSIIYAIANVTFFGQDLVGNEVDVTASALVDFGRFASQ